MSAKDSLEHAIDEAADRVKGRQKVQWKPDRAITIHANGTVSFFSVLRQTWERRQAAAIGSADLATMPDSDREAIARAAKRHPTPGE